VSATLLRPAVPRVPVEYVGLARRFRDAVQAIDTETDRALAAITAPLRARARRHPKLRHEQIAQAERVYRGTVPSDFRIGTIAIDRDRASFRIAETRICPTWMNDCAWQDVRYREPGVALSSYTIAPSEGTYRAVARAGDPNAPLSRPLVPTDRQP
jgi:hypothetical protein